MTDKATVLPQEDIAPRPWAPGAKAPWRWAFRLTYAGLVAERLWHGLWPLLALCAGGLGALALGLWDVLGDQLSPTSAAWAAIMLGGGFCAAVLWACVYAFLRLRWPSRDAALEVLDQTLQGRPLTALRDAQAIGVQDPASAALWRAHQERMARKAAEARVARPDLRVAARDPYALRYAAAVMLLVGLLFGSIWRAGNLSEILPGGGTPPLAGPQWEGWVEPPRYTGLPTLYLNDLDQGALELVENSQITLRFYGPLGALKLTQSVQARAPGADPKVQTSNTAATAEPADLANAGGAHQFTVTRPGNITIETTDDGSEMAGWQVAVLSDQRPRVDILGSADLASDGSMSVPFSAQDDYGVVSGEVTISLDLPALDRRHGLGTPPDPRAAMTLPLPISVSGDRRMFQETLIEEFSEHPWANLPVIFSFTALDAAGQTSSPAELRGALLARRFFDPLAAALIEQRRDLLWARANGARVAQILRTLTHEPQDLFPTAGPYLQLRTIQRRLEAALADGRFTTPEQEDIAAALWDLAQQLENGDVGSALERMRQAQERLSQAMRDGASDDDIARLMQELRDATQDYLRQLSRQAQQNSEGSEGERGADQDSIQLSQSDLQAMMDRIQELMEQGRMAEAEQALREFQQMMENMQVTEGQSGQGGSQGQQAMEGLAETLREQQGLSDQAFRDLQEQYNPNAQAGESQGNEGRNGGQGRGQSHEGQGGQSGEGAGEGQSPGEQGGGGDQSPGGSGGTGNEADDLAQRQQALRNELQRQQNGLPFAGPEGDAARDALDRAGRAMEGAEQSLREGDYAEAIDQQSEAMEALRDGMRALGEAMAEQQQQGQQPGQQQGQGNRQGNALDPLGRSREGQRGDFFGRDMLDDGNANRRAWELLEELRRRSGERNRDEEELEYFRRLLDQF